MGAYFKLWFTNLFFIIITLGMYIPWAIVKAGKYFYSSTSVSEYHFDYHGKGKDIFIGFLIFFVALIFIVVSLETYPAIGILLYFLLILSFPWVFISAYRYDMKMTSFNNIRFDFDGRVLKGYWVLLIAPILILIACYLLSVVAFLIITIVKLGGLDQLGSLYALEAPSMIGLFMQMRFLLILLALMMVLLLTIGSSIIKMMSWSYWINHSLFNKQYFQAKFNFMSIFKINIIALLIASPFLVLAGMAMMDFMQSISIVAMLGVAPDEIAIFKHIGMIYLYFILAVLIAGCYLTAANFKMIAKSTQLGDVRFASSLSFLSLLWITISNFLMIIFTLGLMTPFARIRMARYFAQSTSVIGDIKF